MPADRLAVAMQETDLDARGNEGQRVGIGALTGQQVERLDEIVLRAAGGLWSLGRDRHRRGIRLFRRWWRRQFARMRRGIRRRVGFA